MRGLTRRAAGERVVFAGVNRRPRLVLEGSAASPEEAAAVIAAVEQFLRDTLPPAAPAGARARRRG